MKLYCIILKIITCCFILHENVHAKKTDTTFVISYAETPVHVKINYPSGKIKGTILMLHGWNLPPDQWCQKTSFCSKAIAQGYALIIPDFKKTTYHYQVYPETITKYLAWPTRKWMYEKFFTTLQNDFSLLIKGQNNFVAGISTGGRGAALFALENPEIFKGAACLSADFDQTKISNEPINNGYYGSYKLFPERWEGKDNIYNRADEMRVPLFLAHGKKDKVCPWSQTKNYANKLKEINKNNQLKIVLDENGGHDYLFWEKQTDSILLFFNYYLKN